MLSGNAAELSPEEWANVRSGSAWIRKDSTEASARSTDSWSVVSFLTFPKPHQKAEQGARLIWAAPTVLPFHSGPISVLNHSQWTKINIYFPFKIFSHFSSPSSPFSCLSNEFHHLVLSSPLALFQLSFYKWELIAGNQTQGQLYINILGSSIYGFGRLKAKPFKELGQKWLQIQISLSEVFYFSFGSVVSL